MGFGLPLSAEERNCLFAGQRKEASVKFAKEILCQQEFCFLRKRYLKCFA